MIQFISNIASFWDSLHFVWPLMLMAFPLPWLVRRLWKPANQVQIPLLAPQIMHRVEQQLDQPKWVQPTRQNRIMPMGMILLWSLLILAAMRPVWFLTPTPFNATGKDLILAVDLSGSMHTNDMQMGGHDVNRLTAVKSVVHEFIQKRQGDRMGLVVFGTQAFIQSPLTYDLKTVQTLLDETAIGMAGNNTAIGDAIGLTLKHLKSMGASGTKTVLILLTDGSNTAGAVQPLEAAKMASKAGLKIYTIAIGRQKSPGLGAFFNPSSNDMDVATLKNIAKITGGEFFYAPNTRILDKVYQTINKLESSPYKLHQYRLQTELYPWPLGLFMILSLLLVVRQKIKGQL
jgi:Ca-activated chloride channel family protein